MVMKNTRERDSSNQGQPQSSALSVVDSEGPDPSERRKLAAEQLDRVKKLAGRMDSFLQGTQAVVSVKNPNCVSNAYAAPRRPMKQPVKNAAYTGDIHLVLLAENQGGL